MKNLHITNGDGAAGIIQKSSIEGDVLPWRDPMHHGPFPGGLKIDELSKIRVEYLAGPDLVTSEVEQDFRSRVERLKYATEYESVILWFEHDLLDQLQLLQILDWFHGVELSGTSLEIICINSFPGIETFRGIGQLTSAQMASLWEHRVSVTNEMMELGKSGWKAFRSDDPRYLLKFLEGDLSAMPFLRSALLRHLEEYPSAGNGLSRTEQQILSLVAEGVFDPVSLFIQNMNFETALYIGDWRTYSIILQLCDAKLLTCEPSAFDYKEITMDKNRDLSKYQLKLTLEGKQVLSGTLDASELADRDEWLGGVHIQTNQLHWRWDRDKKSFAQRIP